MTRGSLPAGTAASAAITGALRIRGCLGKLALNPIIREGRTGRVRLACITVGPSAARALQEAP